MQRLIPAALGFVFAMGVLSTVEVVGKGLTILKNKLTVAAIKSRTTAEAAQAAEAAAKS